MIYRPLINYRDFITLFQTEADSVLFYVNNHAVYCPECGCGKYKFFRKEKKPYMAYCTNCHKEFSVLKEDIYDKSHVDFRCWLYLGYMYYCLRASGNQRLNLKVYSRELGVAYTTILRMDKKLKVYFAELENVTRERLYGALDKIVSHA